MKRITAIDDQEILFDVELSKDNTARVSAVDMLVLWDQSSKGSDLDIRYQAFRQVISDKLGEKVNMATAYLILETAVAQVSELKKTHIV